jgi:hypothetical protein
MLALGVAIGRFAIPKVVIVTKVEVHEVTKIVKVKAKDIVRTTKTVTEGTKTTTETITKIAERTGTETATNTETVGAKITTSGGDRASWRLSGLGGMLILPKAGGGTPEVSWLVGAGAERRVVGPLWAGFWGMGGPKGGAAGISISGEF